MKHSIFYFTFLLLITSSLHTHASSRSPTYDSIPDYQNINLSRLDSAVRFELSLLTQNSDSKSIYIKHWYEKHNFDPIWIQPSLTTFKTDTLLGFISHIDVHGLKSDQLDYPKMLTLRNQLKNGKLSYSELAKFDIKLSNLYILYCAGLHYGFINPGIFEAYHKSIRKADSSFIFTSLKAEKIHLLNYLSRIQPRTKAYLTLQAEKDNYSFFIDSTFEAIPLLADKQIIKLWTSDASLPLIARRLMITGELPFDPNYEISYRIFNRRLLKAINVFRTKTGLMIDEEIGNSTINALNMTFAEYINKINVNLERLRWVPVKPLGKKFIRVNVADMTLKAYKNDTVALTMKVCVGRPLNMTPLLQSMIFELIINPTWTVPNSIIVKEIAVKASKNISYFEKNHIRVYLQGTEIDPSTVDWTKITTNHQPYKMVQDSGSKNSLGRIKFNFKNPFSVYLHDTNLKSAFKHHDRAVSHGCVRVEKPVELLNFCFPDLSPVYKTQIQKNELLIDKIRHSIDLKVLSKTGKEQMITNPNSMKVKKVELNPFIPIVMDYQTCFINLKGNIMFREDIYKLDILLNKQLGDISI
jgi:murein L,D-transpeptidase YcbB/YkuD